MLRVIMSSVVFLFGATMALASPQPSFYCDVQPNPLLKIKVPAGEYGGARMDAFEYDIGDTIYYADGDRIAFAAYPMADEEWWPQVRSGSGVRYEKNGISFHYKGDEGILSLSDGTEFKCLAHDAKYPAAKSLFGTRFREKPDVNGKLVRTLPEGYPMSVVSQTGQYYDDWQWVEVSIDDGETGYVWGGTVCTLKTEVPGVHFRCD